MSDVDGLPELPEAVMHNGVERGYSADQMRAYATAALRSKQPEPAPQDIAEAKALDVAIEKHCEQQAGQ